MFSVLTGVKPTTETTMGELDEKRAASKSGDDLWEEAGKVTVDAKCEGLAPRGKKQGNFQREWTQDVRATGKVDPDGMMKTDVNLDTHHTLSDLTSGYTGVKSNVNIRDLRNSRRHPVSQTSLACLLRRESTGPGITPLGSRWHYNSHLATTTTTKGHSNDRMDQLRLSIMDLDSYQRRSHLDTAAPDGMNEDKIEQESLSWEQKTANLVSDTCDCTRKSQMPLRETCSRIHAHLGGFIFLFVLLLLALTCPLTLAAPAQGGPDPRGNGYYSSDTEKQNAESSESYKHSQVVGAVSI